jgi:trans-aconitate 2-methyltransferase
LKDQTLFEWDAGLYDSLPLPHTAWGAQAIKRLALRGDETVLELGSGTGRDAERLLAALPEGRVIAVDGSQQMLDELGARLGDCGERLRVVHADLREPLHLDEEADAAFSVATLHWLPDHSVVFESIARALRPDGRLVAEAGGEGNIAVFRRALKDVSGEDGSEVWKFAGVDETVARLEAAGFTEIEVRLVPDPAEFERGDQLEAYIATVMLGVHLRELPEAERRPFVSAVAAGLDEPVIDYVRLQISATRQ